MLRRLDQLSPTQSFLLVVVVLAAVYLPTANWKGPLNVDAEAVAVPAWQLATHGEIYLDGLPGNPWYVSRPGEAGHIVSNRPPGAIAWAVPWYLAFGDPSGVSVWPSTLAAVAATLLAMGVLHLALRRVAATSMAIAGALLFGVATATWPVSADQIWSHGPSQLWVALAMLASTTERAGLSGLSMGAGMATRPPLGFMAAALGAVWAILEHSWRKLALFGVGSAIGLLGLLIYNDLVFSGWTLVGGYPSAFATRLVTAPWPHYARNVLGTFVDPANGFLIWSPLFVVLLPGVPVAWRRAPSWSRAGAIAGLLYLLVHARMNRFSGGMPFDYRYPLEALIAAAPLFLLSYKHWVVRRPLVKRVFIAAAVVSVVLQGFVAIALSCSPGPTGAVCSFF